MIVAALLLPCLDACKVSKQGHSGKCPRMCLVVHVELLELDAALLYTLIKMHVAMKPWT